MPRGGPRPRSGRKGQYFYIIDGKQYDSLKAASEVHGVSTKTIHNWCRPDNKKKSNCRMKLKPNTEKQSKPKRDIPDEIKQEAENAEMTPLDYMLKIMRDEKEDKKRRDTMAYWAAPYCHKKAGESKGKKRELGDRAKEAGSGKFSAGKKPQLRAIK